MDQEAMKEQIREHLKEVVNNAVDELQKQVNEHVNKVIAQYTRQIDGSFKQLMAKVASQTWVTEYLERKMVEKGILPKDKSKRDQEIQDIIKQAQAQMQEAIKKQKAAAEKQQKEQMKAQNKSGLVTPDGKPIPPSEEQNDESGSNKENNPGNDSENSRPESVEREKDKKGD